MSSIFDWELHQLGMHDTLKHGTITVSGFGYFHKNCRFLWEKNVSKTSLGSTIHLSLIHVWRFVRNVCFVCRICLGCFAWRTGWRCRPLIEQTDAVTMYNVFYLRLGSTSIGHARHVKTRNDNGFRIWIFSQKLPFSVGKKCFKDKFRKNNTYTYTSYNKYFRLCMVSEELRLNEIGLFL